MVVATRSPDDISHRIDRFIEAQVSGLFFLSVEKCTKSLTTTSTYHRTLDPTSAHTYLML